MQLDNDYVRVVRVHYDAGAKLPEHTHPPGTTVYVYLNDSEGVVFRHSGNNTRAVTRPAVKAGGVRVAAGDEEHHTAENPASTPSDFLRVWFKTDNGGERNLATPALAHRRQVREQADADHAADGHAGQAADDRNAAAQPALLIALPSGETPGSSAGNRTLAIGRFLRIDFLTRPSKPRMTRRRGGRRDSLACATRR